MMSVSHDFASSLGFRILKVILLVVICDGSCLLMLPNLSPLKYLVFLTILLVAASTFCLNMSLTTYPAYPMCFLILGVVAMISFVATRDSGVSYASALFPMMLVGMMVFVPEQSSRLDFVALARFLQKVVIWFLVLHVAAQLLFMAWPFADRMWQYMTIHENMFFAVFGICLSMLLRHWRAATLLVFLAAVSMAIRPTSTFFAGLAVGLGVTCCFLLGRARLAMFMGNAVLTVLIVFPIVFISHPDFVDFIYGLEPMVKEELLGSVSNNSFRMAVLQLAREAMMKTSWLIGQGFSGTTNVDVSLAIDGWYTGSSETAASSQAPVHSDFMIMLWQGGVLGYGLFVLGLMGAIRSLKRALRVAQAAGSEAAAAVLSAFYVLIVVFSVYVSFNPIMQKYSFSYLFWFSLLMLTLACREMRWWQKQQCVPSSQLGRIHNGPLSDSPLWVSPPAISATARR